MTLRTLTLSLFILLVFNGKAQSLIQGKINITQSLPNVQRNFIGFNSGQGNLESVYNFRLVGGLETNPYFLDVFSTVSNRIYWRFPGGTTSNYYNRWGSGYGNSGSLQTFGDNSAYLNINQAQRDLLYKKYAGYGLNTAYPNSRSNVIYPFINSITNNLAQPANVVFCLNVINHYRGYPSNPQANVTAYDTRTETLKDTNKIKAITSLAAFNQSTLSDEFKKTVRQNLDAMLTMVNNGLHVYKIEFGNELFGYAFNDIAGVDYSGFVANSYPLLPCDTKIWLKDDGSAQSISDSYASLWTFAHVAKMYKTLLRDTLQKLSAQYPSNTIYADHLSHMKFGMPVTPTLTSGFRKWDDFMRQGNVKSYIGIDAYVMHPYFDSSNYFKAYKFTSAANTNTSVLAKEFNDVRDSLEIIYNKRFFKKNHVNLINAFPAGTEVWYTEWDINFDNSQLMKVGNTLLHAMLYYDGIMDFFDINANKNLEVPCNKTNPIQLCAFHIPYAKSVTWYPMVRFTNGYETLMSDPNSHTNSEPGKVEYNAVYYAHQLLSPILNDDSVRYLNSLNGGFEYMPNCAFRTFYKKDCKGACCKDVVYIYFNNKSANGYKIDLNQVLSLSKSKCITVSKTYLYANNLYASMGQTTFRPDDVLHTDTAAGAADVTIQRVNGNVVHWSFYKNVDIPKYAVGYIKVETATPTTTCRCGVPTTTATAVMRNGVSEPEAQTDKRSIEAPVRIFPNPNSMGALTIDIGSADIEPVQVSIFDISGNVVRNFTHEIPSEDGLLNIDISGLAPSMYVVKMDGNTIHYTGKLIVQ